MGLKALKKLLTGLRSGDILIIVNHKTGFGVQDCTVVCRFPASYLSLGSAVDARAGIYPLPIGNVRRTVPRTVIFIQDPAISLLQVA